MKNLLMVVAILISGNGFAADVMTCKVYQPCNAKEKNILEYCVHKFEFWKANPKKFQAKITVSKNGNKVYPIFLSAKISDGFTTRINNGTFVFNTGWDHFEHHITLYSNDGNNFGGKLTLEEDSSFRVACKWVRTKSAR